MNKRKLIKPGEKFGKLTIIKSIGRLPNAPRRSLFLCLCDCGNEKKIDAGNLRKPGTRSCGCEVRRHARMTGKKQRTEQTFLKHKYNGFRNSCKGRQIENYLSFEDFKKIVVQNCYYCNKEPVLKNCKHGIPIPINGIDRINSDIDYDISNTVPCCSICNIMKSVLTVTEFYNHLLLLLQNSQKWKELKNL